MASTTETYVAALKLHQSGEIELRVRLGDARAQPLEELPLLGRGLVTRLRQNRARLG